MALAPRTESSVKRMAKAFKRGDHVEWNSEAGRVRGIIVKKVVSDVRIKGMSTMPRKTNPNISSRVIRQTTSQFTKAQHSDF